MADVMMKGDRRPGEGTASAVSAMSALALVDQLLELLETEARQEPGEPSCVFRTQVAQFRAEARPDTGGRGWNELGPACLDACRAFLEGMRALRAEQEGGFREVIAMLRESLKTLAADATHFNSDLARTSERVSALGDIKDIQVLKQSLKEEALTLKRVVEQKQRQDELTQAWLLKRVEGLECSLEATRKAAATDALTRVANRGMFDQTLTQWVAMSADAGRSFVLALIDVDYFKGINDTHGHPMGDRVLVGTAEILRTAVRPSDLVARYGGDEFALLLANITLEQAQKRLAELVVRIAGTPYPGERGGEPVQVTISCGATELARHDDAASLMTRADEALYAAKRQGRNCAVAKRPSRWPGVLSLKPNAGRRRADSMV